MLEDQFREVWRMLLLGGVPVLIGSVAGGLAAGGLGVFSFARDHSVRYTCRLIGVMCGATAAIPLVARTLPRLFEAALKVNPVKALGPARVTLAAPFRMRELLPVGGFGVISWCAALLFSCALLASGRDPWPSAGIILVCCGLPIVAVVLTFSMLLSPLFGIGLHTRTVELKLSLFIAVLAVLSSSGFVNCFVDAVTLGRAQAGDGVIDSPVLKGVGAAAASSLRFAIGSFPAAPVRLVTG